jgi:heterodisulfide reductase subunit A
VCPFDAIEEKVVSDKVYAHVIESLCRGCGNCASTCRVRAIKAKGFTDEQIYAQIKAAFEPV